MRYYNEDIFKDANCDLALVVSTCVIVVVSCFQCKAFRLCQMFLLVVCDIIVVVFVVLLFR